MAGILTVAALVAWKALGWTSFIAMFRAAGGDFIGWVRNANIWPVILFWRCLCARCGAVTVTGLTPSPLVDRGPGFGCFNEIPSFLPSFFGIPSICRGRVVFFPEKKSAGFFPEKKRKKSEKKEKKSEKKRKKLHVVFWPYVTQSGYLFFFCHVQKASQTSLGLIPSQ